MGVVYFNDFESGYSEFITSTDTMSFNNTRVLGPFNSSGFRLELTGLPKHNYIIISMDLYIHDSWDGNESGPGGPDIWMIELDDWIKFRNESSKRRIFKTSFANSVCNTALCRMQSYPEEYPNMNLPRIGAANPSLDGLCSRVGQPQGSNLYFIEKSFPHEGSNLSFNIKDQLVQTNVGDPSCDESWSVDNIKVEVALFE